MDLSIKSLELFRESKKIGSTVEVINILLRAVNDWPNQISTLEEYEGNIQKLFGGPVTRVNLNAFLKKVDYSKSAWEAESLSQLVEVFNYYDEGKSLAEILSDLKISK